MSTSLKTLAKYILIVINNVNFRLKHDYKLTINKQCEFD